MTETETAGRAVLFLPSAARTRSYGARPGSSARLRYSGQVGSQRSSAVARTALTGSPLSAGKKRKNSRTLTAVKGSAKASHRRLLSRMSVKT